MNQTTQSFIRVFEDLVGEVNRRAGVPTSHSFAIEAAANRDGVVRRNRALLIYIRDVRNALQHPKHRSAGDAVEISETFLQEVQSLLDHMRNPPSANSVGVARNQLKVAQLGDRLGDLADEMKQRGFSHLPILDEQGMVIGVFNEAAIFDHLWSDTETIVGRQMQIAEIIGSCRLDANHTESFRFVRATTPLAELVEMFTAISSPTTRIGAAFVTASGNRGEPLQRLITPWDVLATSAHQL